MDVSIHILSMNEAERERVDELLELLKERGLTIDEIKEYHRLRGLPFDIQQIYSRLPIYE